MDADRTRVPGVMKALSVRAGGPLKPGFGLSGDIQISSILSSRLEQVIARAMVCGVE